MLTNMLATGDFITLAGTASNVLTIVAIFVITQARVGLSRLQRPGVCVGPQPPAVGISQGGNMLSTFAFRPHCNEKFPAAAIQPGFFRRQHDSPGRMGGRALGYGSRVGGPGRGGLRGQRRRAGPYRRVAEWAAAQEAALDGG